MNRSDQHSADERITDEHVTDQQVIADQQPWLQQTVSELRQPVAPSVAGQLRAARRTALEQKKNKRSWLHSIGLLWKSETPTAGQKRFSGSWPVWGGAALAGLGAIAVATLFFMQPEPVAVQPSLQAKTESGTAADGNALLEDLPIMAAQDDLQFYQELELLQWLAEEGELDAQG